MSVPCLIALLLSGLGAVAYRNLQEAQKVNAPSGNINRIAPLASSEAFASGFTEQDIQNLQRAQNRMTTMLVVVDRIARKHNISYWICGGTLIGAKRHGGWIPWDGDMDIGMQNEDYQRFQQLARTELDAGMWLQDQDSDEAHFAFHDRGKVRDLHSNYFPFIEHSPMQNGLMIDIFLAGCPYPCCDPESALPTIDVKFGKHTFAAPREWELMLQNQYGADWMKKPPVEKRKPHEGRVAFEAPEWVKKMYPALYGVASHAARARLRGQAHPAHRLRGGQHPRAPQLVPFNQNQNDDDQVDQGEPNAPDAENPNEDANMVSDDEENDDDSFVQVASKVAKKGDGFDGFGAPDPFNQNDEDQVDQGEPNAPDAENPNEDANMVSDDEENDDDSFVQVASKVM